MRLELQSVKMELSASLAAINTEIDALKGTVGGMEGYLSACTDDVTSLQNQVERLSAQCISLENKCKDRGEVPPQ